MTSIALEWYVIGILFLFFYSPGEWYIIRHPKLLSVTFNMPCSSKEIEIKSYPLSPSNGMSSESFYYPCDKPSETQILTMSAKEMEGENVMNCDVVHDKKGREKDDEIASLLQKEADYDMNNPYNVRKRNDYILWDDYFMSIAFLAAKRSKDPQEQDGATIVDDLKRIVSIGYNGFPTGCSDDVLPWAEMDGKKDTILHSKDAYMCHAAVNAILNKISTDVKGSIMFLTTFPCKECAKLIIQSGISEVLYCGDKHVDSVSSRASRIMFHMASIKLRQYKPSMNEIRLDFHVEPEVSVSSNRQRKEAHTQIDIVQFRDMLIKEAKYDCLNATVKRRDGYLTWDDYFTAVACLSAKRSKDPNTQVGCCIVDDNYRVIGIGYNGFPRGCSDDYLPWDRNASCQLHNKYPFVVHAEVNAILNKGSKDVKGSTLYVDLFPCNECAKVIIQAGIREIVYLKDMYHETDASRGSRIMFQMSGVKFRQHVPNESFIKIRFPPKETNKT